MRFIKEGLAYIFILLLLLNDSFPQWTVWNALPHKVFITIAIIGLVISFIPFKSMTLTQNFWYQFRVIVLIAVVIVLLPFLGGQSQIGFTFTEPIFFILIVISVFQLRSLRKRAIEEKNRK